MDDLYQGALSLTDRSRRYWEWRARSYTEVNKEELADAQKNAWLHALHTHIHRHCKNRNPDSIRVLDIGTGPGFMAIIAALEGYTVSAVDFSPRMLEEARINAAAENIHSIDFRQMDAHQTSFADCSFDIIVTRNLTWSLQNPCQAYREWYRILKKGGLLLNYDANWYAYLYDEKAREAYRADRCKVKASGFKDQCIGENFDECEEIAREVPLSRLSRPAWDLQTLKDIGFINCRADEHIWQTVWNTEKKTNFSATPLFEIRARK